MGGVVGARCWAGSTPARLAGPVLGEILVKLILWSPDHGEATQTGTG